MPAGSYGNITGILTGSELDIVNIKVLKNLRHGTLGLLNSATPDNPSVVEGGGTANFKVQKYLQFKEYTAANRNDAGDLTKQELLIKIDKERSEKAHFEIETLELQGLDFKSRAAYTNYIQAGISLSLTALLDALYIDVVVETAKLDKANREVINADFADLDTAVKREGAFRQIARAKVNIARQLTRYNLGSNEADYATFLHKNITNDLLLAMPKGGDSATAIGKELSGVDGIQNIAGLGAVKDHIFLGKDMAKTTAMSEDRDFMFGKV